MRARCSGSRTCIRACTAARCGWRWTRRPRSNRRRSALFISAGLRCAASRRWTGLYPALRIHPVRPRNLRRRLQRDARRVHALSRQDGHSRRDRARPPGRRDRRRKHRLREGRRSPARHVRSVLRPQQYVRADSDRRPVPWRRQQRGFARHQLRGGRPARRAKDHGQSGQCDRARPASQICSVAGDIRSEVPPSPGAYDQNFIPPSR